MATGAKGGHDTESRNGNAAKLAALRQDIVRLRQEGTLYVVEIDEASFFAVQLAASLLYGGIHFSFDNVDGLSSGRCVGQAISERVRFRNEDND